ncbi:MAG: hypothetical protein E7Z67_06790 [Thermoplasmata archaeon]|nr:hypothetical protein [Thermoplasmata archaeon]
MRDSTELRGYAIAFEEIVRLVDHLLPSKEVFVDGVRHLERYYSDIAFREVAMDERTVGEYAGCTLTSDIFKDGTFGSNASKKDSKRRDPFFFPESKDTTHASKNDKADNTKTDIGDTKRVQQKGWDAHEDTPHIDDNEIVSKVYDGCRRNDAFYEFGRMYIDNDGTDPRQRHRTKYGSSRRDVLRFMEEVEYLGEATLDLLDDMTFDHQERTAALAWSLCHAYREMCGSNLKHPDIDRLWQILHNFWKITDDTDDMICDLADRDVEYLNMINPCSGDIHDTSSKGTYNYIADMNADTSDHTDTECDDPDEMEGTDKGPEDIILEIVTGEENIDEPDGSGIRMEEIPRPEAIMHYIVNKTIRNGRKVKEISRDPISNRASITNHERCRHCSGDIDCEDCECYVPRD